MSSGAIRHGFGDVTLTSGAILADSQITYETHGTLNAARDNAILFPTWFGGQHPANHWIIGPQWGLDPSRYFIIVVNIIGNGASSSPSNSPSPGDGPRFPHVSVLDNVRLQKRLLEDAFGIQRLRLIVGRSMGAQVAFQWGTAYPDAMDALLPFVGSARTSPHNWVFLENVRLAIESDPDWKRGDYDAPLTTGLNRMGLVFDSWGLSQDWYRQGLYRDQGFATPREFLSRPRPAGADGNDVLAQVSTWQGADLSANDLYDGDYAAALGAITARTIVMPCRTDLYFPPEDSAIEVSLMPNAQLRVIDSVWGHRAGAPGGTDPVDTAFIDRAIRDLLDGAV